jgi:pyruvate-ferredoxin/flavodoxin oxidoreductase
MAMRLYRRLFANKAVSLPEDGVETVLDGNSAVAVTEAGIAEGAALGTSFPSGNANLAWRSEQEQRKSNAFGELLATWDAEGGRGSLAAAMGLAMSGQRATAFLSGQDLASSLDLLKSATGRHLPLVAHLENRALAAQGGALGAGHESLHLAADGGCFTLVASNVQQAADFTLIARRVAEQTLVPGLVALDLGEAVQDVRLPSPALARRYLGAADGEMDAPTEAQRLLFGEKRRRVPIWHDLDNPVLQGALQNPDSFALGAVAQQPYFDRHVAKALNEAFDLYAEQAGRRHGVISAHQLDDAQTVLVAQGAAVETAKAVAGHLRKTQKTPIGVLGIHCLRPFPGEEIARLLSGKKTVVVLERVNTPLAGDAPLMRELRAVLDRASENARYGADTHPGYPAVAEAARPRLRSVIYGLGGQPLRAADLIALTGELAKRNAPRLYMGLDLAHATSAYPKRQVLLDNLRRSYPEIADLGVMAKTPAPDLRPADALTLAIHRVTGQGGDGLASEAGDYLQRLLGGQLRSRPGLAWERYGAICTDHVTSAPEGLLDCGDDVTVDFSLVTAGQVNALQRPLAGLREGGCLLLIGSGLDKKIWRGLPGELRAAIRAKKINLYSVQPAGKALEAAGVQKGASAADLAHEHLLGALGKCLLDSGLIDVKERRLGAARNEALVNLSELELRMRMGAFQAGYGSAHRLDYADLEDGAEQAVRVSDKVPMAVRQLGRNDDRYNSLPRFWDQVGVLYRNGQTEALTADPYMALGTVPPLSSTFHDLSAYRTMLPAFDPLNCSGCGKCWAGCPDGAIGAVAINPGALIDSGIRLTGADPLRQTASKLAGRIGSLGRSKATKGGVASQLLHDAYSWLQEKMPLAEDRKQAMQEAFDAVVNRVGPLPVAITKPFFHDLEAGLKDSGALLSLVVNPDACKGCGICVAVCEPGAMAAEPQSAERLDVARTIWNLWEETPDTPSEVIEKVGKNPEVGSMPAVLLSRFCAMAVAGGDGAEAGSGEKIAVRMSLAATEYQQQPLVHKFSDLVQETRQRIKDHIRETLTQALPTEDLDALSAGLDKVKGGHVQVGELTGKVESAIESGSVNASQLRRLINIANELTELQWRLTEGEHGLGRSRFALAVAPGSVATWAGAFPHNPFQVPVSLDMTGDAAQMAAGLLKGQLREATEAQVLLRRANLELEHPAGIEQKRAELERVGWRDLTSEEQQLCPPLILLGNDESLAGRGFAQIAWLLNSDLPVKILVLSDLGLGLDGKGIQDAPLAASKDPRSDLGLLALAQRGAYVAQTSIAASGHLRQSVREALKYNGPALIHAHVPSPERHGFAAERTLQQAELALNSRAFPLFRYHPEGEGVFGSRIDLEGNPEPKAAWAENLNGAAMTPADWALTERRFAARFNPLSGDEPKPTALLDWLKLDAKGRQGATPTISLDRGGEEPLRYSVDLELAEMVGRREQVWRTLQELSGLETPFTKQVEEEVQSLVAQAHKQELEATRQEYEQRISNLQKQQKVEAANQVRAQLLKLAGYQ